MDAFSLTLLRAVGRLPPSPTHASLPICLPFRSTFFCAFPLLWSAFPYYRRLPNSTEQFRIGVLAHMPDFRQQHRCERPTLNALVPQLISGERVTDAPDDGREEPRRDVIP